MHQYYNIKCWVASHVKFLPGTLMISARYLSSYLATQVGIFNITAYNITIIHSVSDAQRKHIQKYILKYILKLSFVIDTLNNLWAKIKSVICLISGHIHTQKILGEISKDMKPYLLGSIKQFQPYLLGLIIHHTQSTKTYCKLSFFIFTR